MKLLSIKTSTKPDKKYMATFDNDGRTKTTHFGAAGMDDFTKTKDTAQRDRYRQRHRKDLETNDPTKAGYLSWYILWNLPTISASIANYKSRFNL